MLAGAVVVDLGDAVANGVAANAALASVDWPSLLVSIVAVVISGFAYRQSRRSATASLNSAKEAKRANALTKEQITINISNHQRERQETYRMRLSPTYRALGEARAALKRNDVGAVHEQIDIVHMEYPQAGSMLRRDQAENIGPAVTALTRGKSQWLKVEAMNKRHEIVDENDRASVSLARSSFEMQILLVTMALGDSYGSDNYEECFKEPLTDVIEFGEVIDEVVSSLRPRYPVPEVDI